MQEKIQQPVRVQSSLSHIVSGFFVQFLLQLPSPILGPFYHSAIHYLFIWSIWRVINHFSLPKYQKVISSDICHSSRNVQSFCYGFKIWINYHRQISFIVTGCTISNSLIELKLACPKLMLRVRGFQIGFICIPITINISGINIVTKLK